MIDSSPASNVCAGMYSQKAGETRGASGAAGGALATSASQVEGGGPVATQHPTTFATGATTNVVDGLRATSANVGNGGSATGGIGNSAGDSSVSANSERGAPIHMLSSPLPLTPTGEYPNSVVTAELNGDGKLDLVTVNSGADSINVLLGKGDGTFEPGEYFDSGVSPYWLAISDLNGDGMQDVITANSASDTISVILGETGGNFAEQVDYPTGDYPVALSLGKLDGDDDLDIATANYDAGTVSVLLGLGRGKFGGTTEYPTSGQPQWLALGDVNGDGWQDICIAQFDPPAVTVLHALGGGKFTETPSRIWSGPLGNFQLLWLAHRDVNGDGLGDILAATSLGRLHVLLATGNGTFAVTEPYGTGCSPVSVTLGDLNGDGIMDVVVACASRELHVLLGARGGTFDEEWQIPIDAEPLAVALADLDADGWLDIIVASRRGAIEVSLGPWQYWGS